MIPCKDDIYELRPRVRKYHRPPAGLTLELEIWAIDLPFQDITKRILGVFRRLRPCYVVVKVDAVQANPER